MKYTEKIRKCRGPSVVAVLGAELAMAAAAVAAVALAAAVDAASASAAPLSLQRRPS